jgi:hypothetical protein
MRMLLVVTSNLTSHIHMLLVYDVIFIVSSVIVMITCRSSFITL